MSTVSPLDGSLFDGDGAASSLLSSLPLCAVILDPSTLRPVAANALFESTMGALYKFSESDFVLAACEDEVASARTPEDTAADGNRDRLREGISAVLSGRSTRERVRNVEMLSVGGEAGFPVRRFFDWFVSRMEGLDVGGEERPLLLLGDAIGEQDEEQRAKDAELIDFFQNAPIALHWLSGEGKVIWANQTELNVLGYTAEEYIGQPIMKFCPDEEELVLEIFKQLGSGNAIRDVPVRFRTKDGKIVNLLIDSNVRYNRDGSFGHTRCFIRDDTGRKIREARNKLWAEESKRTLDSLDHFMSRTMHHLRTPLHVTQNMVDSLAGYLGESPDAKGSDACTVFTARQREECLELVRLTNDQIVSSVKLLDDSRDLAKFDQGYILNITRTDVELEQFGNEIVQEEVLPLLKPEVKAILELGAGGSHTAGAGKEEGPSVVATDPKVLKRALVQLLANAADATESGAVTLAIGYSNGGRLTFVVGDTGPGFDMPDVPTGSLPPIFQKYTTAVVVSEDDGSSALGLGEASGVGSEHIREKILKGISCHKKNGLGIGLSLAYHLVQALGGELRCTSAVGKGARFEFSLPNAVRVQVGTPNLAPARIVRRPTATKSIQEEISQLFGRSKRPIDDTTDDNDDKSGVQTAVSDLTLHTKKKHKHVRTAAAADVGIPASFEMPVDCLPTVPSSTLAEKGVKCQTPPSVLVVEDTKACAKMLCMILNKFGCSTKHAENGKITVDLLREADPGMYDLIFMDLRMPVMDGIEATRIIKKEGVTVPVIALTGDFNQKTRDECNDVGFDDFHGKPLKRNDLKAVIKKHTGYEVK